MNEIDYTKKELFDGIGFIEFLVNERLSTSFSVVNFEKFCKATHFILIQWSSHEYVGISLDNDFKYQYQKFFKAFAKYLKYIEENPMKTSIEEQEMLKNTMCEKGQIIYRYLSLVENQEIQYNKYYVSWSFIKESYYLESKLYGNVYKLYSKISENNIGIDLLGFFSFVDETYELGIPCSIVNEKEVVYPTLKNDIFKIEKIREIKDFEEEEGNNFE